MVERDSETARYLLAWATRKAEDARAKLASPRLDYPLTQYVRGELAALTALQAELNDSNRELFNRELLLIKPTSYLDDY